MTPLRMQFRKWLEYSEIADVGEMARRYFAMNAFDGVLTMIGVLMGNYMARVREPRVIVVTGLSTSLAMGISGLWGSYLTESAERRREIDELEKQTLVDLQDTKIGKASRMAAVVVAVVDGLSPFLASLLVLLPFFVIQMLPSIEWGYYASIGMALMTLFGLGLFLGHISKENLIVSGLKTVIAGAVSIALSYLLE
ncbi:MAG: VIT1/CCC1 transporter family protein [Anaerolineae bacterium]|nr:VIT1/CCC1 transporter family protein [Anaerolineae bacterium]